MCALTGSSSTTSIRSGSAGASSVQLIVCLRPRGDVDLMDEASKVLDKIVTAPSSHRLFAQDLDRFSTRPHRLIGPRRGDRLVGVDQPDDLRRQRDRVTFDAVWVPRAVQPLMVVTDDNPDR